jgi:hypothetical protein
VNEDPRTVQASREEDDEFEAPRGGLIYWIVARWALLVLNVTGASGWIFFLSWKNLGNPWVGWVTRAVIAVQLFAGILGLLAAYRRGSPGDAILVEAWVYLFIAMACCFTLGLSLVI